MHPTWPSLTPTSTRLARGARLSFLRCRHTVGSFRACGCRLFCPTLPPSPAKDCACRLSRADPRLQSSQHPLRLRKRYVRSVGALAGLASLRHPRGRASWRVRRTADAPLTHCCHPPVQHSCAGVRHATCDMRVVGAVPVVCARLLPRLRESTFRPRSGLLPSPCAEWTRASSLRSTSSVCAQGICTLWVPSSTSLLGATRASQRVHNSVTGRPALKVQSRTQPLPRHDARCRQTHDLL